MFSNQRKYYYNMSEDSAIAPNKNLLNLLFVVLGNLYWMTVCVRENFVFERQAGICLYVYLGAGGVGYSLDSEHTRYSPLISSHVRFSHT